MILFFAIAFQLIPLDDHSPIYYSIHAGETFRQELRASAPNRATSIWNKDVPEIRGVQHCRNSRLTRQYQYCKMVDGPMKGRTFVIPTVPSYQI